jgi:RND family efflux transporter MFP subunit
VQIISGFHRSVAHFPLRGLIVAATAVSLAACGGDGDVRAETTPQAVTVGPENIYVAREDTLESGPPVSGTLAAEQSATVRAEVSGPVLQTYVEAGQRVARGTLLARIDATGISDAVASARSAVATAQSAATIASREEQRAERLLAAGAVAERDLETARNARVAADAQLAAARAQLATAQRNYGNTEVRAPFAGVVSNRAVSGGDVVSPGTELFTVLEPSSMRFEADVPASAVGDVHLGDRVSFSVAGYPDRVFAGRVTRINPVADPTTRQVRLLVSVPNTGNALVGGLFAEGRVASERHAGVVAPETAVDQRGTEPAVYRLSGGKVEKVTVALGLRDAQSERVELANGVAVGDTLLTGAAQGITPGSLVRVSQPSDTPVAKR